MRRIGVRERRARLGLRHRLTERALAAEPVEVARSLTAVHGTDPSSTFIGIATRMQDGKIDAVEHALYQDRTLIRLLGMRRTIFVTSLDTAPVVQAACGLAIAARERAKLLAWLADSDITGDRAAGPAEAERWLADAEQAALQALAELGEATAAEIAAADPRLAAQIVLARGKAYEGRQNVASRVLFLLAAQGQVVRTRPRGSWTSHQHRWALTERWCPAALDGWTSEDARAELARRWLHGYGPATVDDLYWWTGWTKTQARRALARIEAAEVDLDGGPGVLLADDLEPPPTAEPWAALLPGLDSTPMGWQQRDWYLGEHGPLLFDRNGNVGPTVWWDGRIVGGWGQDKQGEVVWRLLDDVGSDAEAMIEAAAARLAGIIGPVRLTARTRRRTWLEQELAD